MDQSIITAPDAAAELGITKQRLYVLIREGRVKAQKFGAVWMIRRADLAAVKDRKPGRPPKTKTPKGK